MAPQTWPTRTGGASPTLRSLWGYVQRELLLSAWAMTEVALVVPVFLASGHWGAFWSPVTTTLWMFLILMLSFNLVRLMGFLQVAPERQRDFVVVALLLVLLITLPTLLYRPRSLFDIDWIALFLRDLANAESPYWRRDLSIFLVTVLLWWRGIRLSNQALSIERAGLRLRLGGLIGSPLVAWYGRRLQWEMTPFLMLFLFASTIAVALARAEQVEQDRSGHSASLGPRWLTGVAAASVGVVITSGLIASAISQGSASLLSAWMSPLWRAMLFSGAIVVNVVGYLSQPLFALLALLAQWMMNLIGRAFSSLNLEALTIPNLDSQIPGTTSEAAERAEPLFNGGPAIVLLLMLALVLLIGLTLSRVYRHPSPAAIGDEPYAGGGGAESGQRLSPGRRLLQRLGLIRRHRLATSIRRIYREMSEAAAASGYPRAVSETPLEYLDTLALVWPKNVDDSRHITNAYIRVRYGELPETRQEFDQISAAWQRLKHTRPLSISSEAVYAQLEK